MRSQIRLERSLQASVDSGGEVSSHQGVVGGGELGAAAAGGELGAAATGVGAGGRVRDAERRGLVWVGAGAGPTAVAAAETLGARAA